MFTLYYLLFSLFILVGNVSELDASASEFSPIVVFDEKADNDTAVRLGRLSIKEFNKAKAEYKLRFTDTHFTSLRKAIKEILLRVCKSLKLEELPAVFETFNYPNQEFLTLNYKNLKEVIDKNLEKPLTMNQKVSLVMNFCIDDTRHSSSDSVAFPRES